MVNKNNVGGLYTWKGNLSLSKKSMHVSCLSIVKEQLNNNAIKYIYFKLYLFI